MKTVAKMLMFALIMLPGFCSGQTPSRTVDIPSVAPSSNVSVPNWSNGLLVQWTHTEGAGDRPKIWAHDGSGSQPIPTTEIWFPTTASARIHTAVATPDHLVVASVLAWSLTGQMTTLLCFIGPNGITKAIQTDQYIAEHLQYAPDGVLWAFGKRAMASQTDVNGDARTVRRFSPDGTELSATVRGPYLGTKGTRLRASQTSLNGESFLLVASTRKFLFNSSTRRFLEMNNEGKILRIATLEFPANLQVGGKPRKLGSAAITPSGRIYCALSGGDGPWQLDPDTLKWTPIDRKAFDSQYGGLYGSDGESLILKMVTAGNRYGWFPLPAMVSNVLP